MLGEVIAFNCGHFEPIYNTRLTGTVPPCELKKFLGKNAFSNTPCRKCKMRQVTQDRLTGERSASIPVKLGRASSDAGNRLNRGHPPLFREQQGQEIRRSATVNYKQQVQNPELDLRRRAQLKRAGEKPLPPSPPPSPPVLHDARPSIEFAQIGTARQQPPRQKAALVDIPKRSKPTRKSSLEDLLTADAEVKAFTAHTILRKPSLEDMLTQDAELKAFTANPGQGRPRSRSDLRRCATRKYSEGERPRPTVPVMMPVRSTSRRYHPPKAGKRIQWAHPNEWADPNDAVTPADGSLVRATDFI